MRLSKVKYISIAKSTVGKEQRPRAQLPVGIGQLPRVNFHPPARLPCSAGRERGSKRLFLRPFCRRGSPHPSTPFPFHPHSEQDCPPFFGERWGNSPLLSCQTPQRVFSLEGFRGNCLDLDSPLSRARLHFLLRPLRSDPALIPGQVCEQFPFRLGPRCFRSLLGMFPNQTACILK